jgi:predicted porin
MKKSLLALAALTAFAGVASAQSSVTAFGIVDLAARNVKNGSAGSVKSLSSGGQATSRIGFRGVEDLGGGLRGGFWLESEVAPDSGGAGSTVAGANVFWARRATVSLMGGFGEVRLGRDLNVSYTSLGAFDPFGYVGVASIANVRGSFLGLGGATTGVRSSNTITYYLPAMGGLYGGLMVGAGEGSTGTKYTGVRLGYAAGPLNISGASAKTAKGGTMIDDLTTMNFGASFNMGFATIGAAYEKSEYSTQDNTLMTVYTTIPMGKGLIKAQYTKSSGTGPVGRADAYDATQFGLGYVYSMSKRTSLYTNYGSINNGGTAVTGASYTATGSGPAGMARGATSTGYEFGIRHDF